MTILSTSPSSLLLIATVVGLSLVGINEAAAAADVHHQEHRLLRTNTNTDNGSSSSSSSSSNQKKNRRQLIVNGANANPEAFPFFAYPMGDDSGNNNNNNNKNNNNNNNNNNNPTAFLCGASLIHPEFLLTAARCQGVFNYGVNMYDPSSKQYKRSNTINGQFRHPGFQDYNWDVLLMRLSEPVYDIEPVRLNEKDSVPTNSSILTAIGMGYDKYDGGKPAKQLQGGSFVAITNEECANRMSALQQLQQQDSQQQQQDSQQQKQQQGGPQQQQDATTTTTTTTSDAGSIPQIDGNDILCVDPMPGQGSSICIGDSGDPLLLDDENNPGTYYQVGVASFTNQCQTDQFPDGFARVSAVYSWIQRQVCLQSLNKTFSGDCRASLGDKVSVMPDNPVVMKLVFQYPYAAQNIYFSIRDKADDKVVYTGPQYIPDRNDLRENYLFLSPGEYTMEVYNFVGEGLLDTSGQDLSDGSWELYALDKSMVADDAVLVASSNGADFGKEQVTDFTVLAA